MRGAATPRLQGTYPYGDFCSGKVWGAQRFEGAWDRALVFDVDANVRAFGEDEAGEIYVTDSGTGTVYRIVGAGGGGDDAHGGQGPLGTNR